jgi:hypothetical protein
MCGIKEVFLENAVVKVFMISKRFVFSGAAAQTEPSALTGWVRVQPARPRRRSARRPGQQALPVRDRIQSDLELAAIAIAPAGPARLSLL